MRNRTAWLGAAGVAALLCVIVVSCGGTGGGGSHQNNPGAQFVLNSNSVGQLILNVNPKEVDANKSDRIGLVATLTDPTGRPLQGVAVTFTSDIPDILFIPNQVVGNRNVGVAFTDANGNADIIAVAGATPTGTGGFVGTGAIFAEAQPLASPVVGTLLAQMQVTLNDVGFVDALTFAVIPASIDLVEPAPGTPLFFSIVGGTPPYGLSNPSSGIGVASISQHCTAGCTENGGVLCVGSPCQTDADCGVGSPADTCIGPVKRCVASCAGSNCAGARCDTDADCNNGATSPANVCKDSTQTIVYIVGSGNTGGTHTFQVTDSAGNSVDVSVNVTFRCGNGVARGDEQCDFTDVNNDICVNLTLPDTCTLSDVCGGFGVPAGGTAFCGADCTFTVANCPTPQPTPSAAPVATATP